MALLLSSTILPPEIHYCVPHNRSNRRISCKRLREKSKTVTSLSVNQYSAETYRMTHETFIFITLHTNCIYAQTCWTSQHIQYNSHCLSFSSHNEPARLCSPHDSCLPKSCSTATPSAQGSTTWPTCLRYNLFLMKRLHGRGCGMARPVHNDGVLVNGETLHGKQCVTHKIKDDINCVTWHEKFSESPRLRNPPPPHKKIRFLFDSQPPFICCPTKWLLQLWGCLHNTPGNCSSFKEQLDLQGKSRICSPYGIILKMKRNVLELRSVGTTALHKYRTNKIYCLR